MKADDTEIIKHNLKRYHLFSKLTELQLDKVCQFSQLQQLAEGQQLFSQDDKVTSFYMILIGQIKLYRMSPDGQEKIIDIVKSGKVFAEALMFNEREDANIISEKAKIESDDWE